MKLKKGDKIKVIAGKDKGRDGVIERVYASSHAILVPGLNMIKKGVKKSEKMPQGGFIDVPRPISAGKVMLICPKTNKPTRIKFVVKDGKKYRYSLAAKAII